MATELRLRRGTTDEHGNFIGAEAEATVDTDKNTIVVHDGQTQGGFPLAQESDTAPAVDSVATLRTSSFPANLERLYLSGYYGAGTAGGGLLYRDSGDTTTDDNGGTVFVDGDGLRWKRSKNTILAQDFGVSETKNGSENAGLLQNAIDYVNSKGGGVIGFLSGTFDLETVDLKSNVHYRGEGRKSVVINQTGTSTGRNATFYANSGSASAFVDNIVISDLEIRGQVDSLGFAQFEHLLSLNGVSNVSILRCNIVGMRGDGIYLGSGINAGDERHNKDVMIEQCTFDGINKDNRNGVSVIDCRNLTIQDNKFANMTRDNMPGPIAVEPNGDTFAIIKNIKIARNDFFSNGGASGTIIFFLKNALEFTTTPQGFWVYENQIDNGNLSVNRPEILLDFKNFDFAERRVTVNDPSYEFFIRDNIIKGSGGGAILVYGISGFTIKGNTIKKDNGFIAIGRSNNELQNSIRGVVSDNKIFSPGNTGSKIGIYDVFDLDINGNHFYDDTDPRGIRFDTALSSGVISGESVVIRNNIFNNNITDAVSASSNYGFTDGTIKLDGNLYVDFTPVESSIPQSVPIINSQFFGLKYDSSRLPDSFDIGEYTTVVNGDGGVPDTDGQGIIKTEKFASGSGFRKFIHQWFFPATNSGADVDAIYWRRASASSNTWASWREVTGTAV